jgi:peroxiredoxin
MTSSEKPNKPSSALIVFLIFPLIGIVAAFITIATSGQTAGGVPPTPAPVTLADTSLVDKPAPNFELTDLEGDSVRLSSYRGRVVFVNFWATWCEPCQRELPAFQSYMAGENGAVILAVNAGETLDQINTYFEEHDIHDVPTLLDTNLAIYDLYNIDRLPTTYVIDPAGVVRYRHLGEMTTADLQAYADGLSN